MDVSLLDMVYYLCIFVYNNYMVEDQKKVLQVKVLYFCFKKKEREIFGGLVFYGKLWCLGVNEGIEVSFFQLVEIGGIFVNVGIYIMNVIIYLDYWMIYFFIECGVVGIVNLDFEKVIVFVKVKVKNVFVSNEFFIIGF